MGSHMQVQAALTNYNELHTQLAAAAKDLASCRSQHTATANTLRQRLSVGPHGHGALTDLAASLEAKDPAAAVAFRRFLQD